MFVFVTLGLPLFSALLVFESHSWECDSVVFANLMGFRFIFDHVRMTFDQNETFVFDVSKVGSKEE